MAIMYILSNFSDISGGQLHAKKSIALNYYTCKSVNQHLNESSLC